MEAPKSNNHITKVFNVCVILMGFFFAAAVILGISNKKMEMDIEVFEIYLDKAANVKPNFEESLSLYTQGTQEEIDYVQTLRPDSEEKYIDFISSLEGIGQEMGLEVSLESLDSDKPDNLGSTLRYELGFFGSESELLIFLEKLEALPYYIRVEGLQFESLDTLNPSKLSLNENIRITLSLYVR